MVYPVIRIFIPSRLFFGYSVLPFGSFEIWSAAVLCRVGGDSVNHHTCSVVEVLLNLDLGIPVPAVQESRKVVGGLRRRRKKKSGCRVSNYRKYDIRDGLLNLLQYTCD